MTLLAKAVLIDHDPQMRWVNAFISNDVTMADPHRLYLSRAALPEGQSAALAAVHESPVHPAEAHEDPDPDPDKTDAPAPAPEEPDQGRPES